MQLGKQGEQRKFGCHGSRRILSYHNSLSGDSLNMNSVNGDSENQRVEFLLIKDDFIQIRL